MSCNQTDSTNSYAQQTSLTNGPERWLIVGACGQLGAHVHNLLVKRERERAQVHVLATSRRSCHHAERNIHALDLLNMSSLKRILESFRPTHVVYAAGSPGVKLAGADASAWLLNVTVPGRIAAYAQANDAWMFYPSSDFVWDGNATRRYRESDIPTPQCAYGIMKRRGEETVLGRGAGAVCRLSLLYGAPRCDRDTAFTRIIGSLRVGESVRMVVDETRTPVYLPDAARAVVELGVRAYRGIVHIAGPDAVTPFSMACSYRTHLQSDSAIEPTTRAEYSPTSDRPRNVSQDDSKLSALLGRSLTPFNRACKDLANLCRTTASSNTRLSQNAPATQIIVLAHDGAKVIWDALRSIARQSGVDAYHVIVAVNGCSDNTMEAASRAAKWFSTMPTVQYDVLECESGRAAAINQCEEYLSPGIRIYADHDAVLSENAVAVLVSRLRQGTGIHFGALRPCIARSTSPLVNGYWSTWQRLPYVRDAPATVGVYAVSVAGRDRWDRFPDVHSDDKFVRLHFSARERVRCEEATYQVQSADTVAELVAARRRYDRGNVELRRGYPDLAARDSGRHRGVARTLLSPRRWPAVAGFATVQLAARARLIDTSL